MSNHYDYKKLRSCGKDVFISDQVVIKHPNLVSIGNHVVIDFGFYIDTAAELGDYIHIGPYVSVLGGEKGLIKIDHFSTVGAGARLICVDSTLVGGPDMTWSAAPEFAAMVNTSPIHFNPFVSIGPNAVIMPGTILPTGSMISAGSVSSQKEGKEWGIYNGNPAEFISYRERSHLIKLAKELGYNIQD